MPQDNVRTMQYTRPMHEPSFVREHAVVSDASAAQRDTTRHCKICAGPVTPRHKNQGIIYWHCGACDFLQNFYWEDHAHSPTLHTSVNEEIREHRWPEGDPVDMRAKGWEMLELMSSPIAWGSRQAHEALSKIFLYRQWSHARARRQFHRLMDFGCGHGTIVSELRKEGFDAIGLDPFSPTESPHILRIPLLESGLPAGTFDGIFSIETHEHITNVIETFQALSDLLRPGGVLLVQTRRLEDPDYQNDGGSWFYLREPEAHVSIYSETAMRRIAENTGFRRVSFRSVKFARFEK